MKKNFLTIVFHIFYLFLSWIVNDSNMEIIEVRDKQFELFISEEVVLKEIQRVADELTNDFKGKEPLFICVLNGAFMFASDLIKQLDFPCEITFVRLKSYQGTHTDGQVKKIQGLLEPVAGRNVVIIEDIIDTGHTIAGLLRDISKESPASLKIATLLFKPDALQTDVAPDYVAIEIPPDFIVGYGMDYIGHGRNLRAIYKIKK